MVAQSAAFAGGAYTPTALSPHEFRTVERLADLIIPVESGVPGAIEAGVPAWIDMLCGVNTQLKTIYVDGGFLAAGLALFGEKRQAVLAGREGS